MHTCMRVADASFGFARVQTQSQEKIDLLRLLGAEVYPVPAVAFENPENYNHRELGLRSGGALPAAVDADPAYVSAVSTTQRPSATPSASTTPPGKHFTNPDRISTLFTVADLDACSLHRVNQFE